MWRQLLEFARTLLTFQDQLQRHAAEIADLKREQRELAAALQRLAYEVHRNHENEAHEREKIVLRLENALLRSERQLPPASEGARSEEPG